MPTIEDAQPQPPAQPERELSTADLARTPDDRATETRSFAEAEVPEAPEAHDGQKTDTSQAAPLFPADEAEDLRGRWTSIQAGFVDEPRKAVEQADGLVATAMKRLAETFADERSSLEGQWDRGDDVSTEDLRLALQRYRSFFGRLLAV